MRGTTVQGRLKDENVDSRVRRTKRLLRQGLTELLSEKSIKKITVRELADRVDINRGTFYLHYKDIYDLVGQIEQELFDEYETILRSYTITDLKTQPHKIFSDVCGFLYANREICAALLGENGDIDFILNTRKFLQDKCLRDISALYHLEDFTAYNYVYAYFEAGAVGLVRHWLEHPEDGKTPEEIATLIENIFWKGASCLTNSGRNEAQQNG